MFFIQDSIKFPDLVHAVKPEPDREILFSYLDTQLTRLGGSNFGQLCINRPLAPINDNR